jgi:hypothetical protein
MLASDLIGRLAIDSSGRERGRVIDVLADRAADGRLIVNRVVISRRRLRLFSFDRSELSGPAVVRWVAQRIQGPVEELPVTAVSFADRPTG